MEDGRRPLWRGTESKGEGVSENADGEGMADWIKA